MAVRAVRGATQLEEDVREHLLERVAEMVLDVTAANSLHVDDFISVIFTSTSDLVSEFPAYAARRLGFGEVPLIAEPPMLGHALPPLPVDFDPDARRPNVAEFLNHLDVVMVGANAPLAGGDSTHLRAWMRPRRPHRAGSPPRPIHRGGVPTPACAPRVA